MPPLPQRGCVGLPSQRQRRALGQRLNSSLDGVVRADPAARPGRGHEQGQPAAQREQAGGEPDRPAGMSGTSSSPSARIMGQNRRRSAKRAVIRTARSTRTLSATTATHRPTVTDNDTWRDKKKTARRAAFPQPAGRFRRWWQVLGSNQRRLSRRFYSPSLLPEVHAADQRIRRSRHDRGLRPSAMRPWASSLVHGRGRKNPRTGAVGAVTPIARPASRL